MRKNEKISESVSRAIVTQATNAGLPAGAVLESEADMMERYSVSRGSLREGLRILEVLGFIHMKPGPKGGPILLSPDSRQFSAMAALFYQRIGAKYSDLLEMRLVMEPEAAGMAAERRSDEQVKILHDYLARSEQANLEDDRQFRAVGQGFHDLIADMAGNHILSLVIHSCYDLFAGKSTGFLYPHDERKCVGDIHNKIARAVIDGNAAQARDLMREHMRDYLIQARERFPEMMNEAVRW
ncbi:MAG: FCD domain-containing protein [Novosphingobium sp.]